MINSPYWTLFLAFLVYTHTNAHTHQLPFTVEFSAMYTPSANGQTIPYNDNFEVILNDNNAESGFRR